MASVLLQVSGRDAEREARNLRGILQDAVGAADSVSPVEVDRSAELVVALIALAFEGVGVTKTVWDWWQERRSHDVEVTVVLQDGQTLNLSAIDEQHLVAEVERRHGPGA